MQHAGLFGGVFQGFKLASHQAGRVKVADTLAYSAQGLFFSDVQVQKAQAGGFAAQYVAVTGLERGTGEHGAAGFFNELNGQALQPAGAVCVGKRGAFGHFLLVGGRVEVVTFNEGQV